MAQSRPVARDEAPPELEVAGQVGRFTASDTLTPGLRSGLYPQFLMLGDSITQFGADEIQLSEDELTHHVQPTLQKYYVRRMDIVNRGFSGYTATMGLQTIRHFLPTHHSSPGSLEHHTTFPVIKLMTIFYGANDACLPGNSQHVPIDEYVSSLSDLVNYPVVEKHGTKCILITPPPVNEYQLRQPLTRKAWHTARYAQEARALACRLQIPCVDAWSAFIRECSGATTIIPNDDDDDDDDDKYTEKDSTRIPGSLDLPPNQILQSLLVDGLHLTGKGYKLLYDELIRTIEKDLPDYTADKMPFIFRPWADCFDS